MNLIRLLNRLDDAGVRLRLRDDGAPPSSATHASSRGNRRRLRACASASSTSYTNTGARTHERARA